MKRLPRSNDDDDGGGLDSLLDTMTNVVGILVMVLIAAQLGVKDAVDRIADSELVDPEKLEETREELQLSRDQRDAIQSQLDSMKPQDSIETKVQLADLRRKLQQTRSQIVSENKTANQFAVKIEADKKKAAEASKKIKAIADSKKARDRLQAELKGALENEAKLKALLEDTPVQEAPPAKVVTLPDPRPAPDGARQVTFLCANNRIYPISADDWRDSLRKKAEFLVAAKRLDGGPAIGVNKDRFMTEFKKANRRNMRDDFLEVELYATGIYPRLRFTPKKNAGATEKEVLNPRSRFQRMLSVLDKSKYYASFVVLPDSYEVYLAARSVAAEKQLLAGWSPQSESYVFTTHLGGKILFGPKPPPPKPDPNPKPPAKPRNVID
jgi:hypothetical protein